MTVGGFVAVGVIFGIYFIVNKWQRRNRDEMFQQLARMLQIELAHEPYRLVFKKPVLKGNFKGYHLKIIEKSVGSGEDHQTLTIIQINPSTSNNFSITREDFFTKAGKIFGVHDIQIGDALLDKKFFFTSEDRELLRQVFDQTTIDKMKLIQKDFKGSIQNKSSKLEYIYPDTIDSTEKKNRLVKNIALIVLILNRFQAETKH